MNKATLLELLASVQSGTITPAAASERLATMPYEDIGHARIDHHRGLRTGLPEVIYAQGKSPEQTAEIFARMAASGTDVLATRADAPTAASVRAITPAAIYHPKARAITLKQSPATEPEGQHRHPQRRHQRPAHRRRGRRHRRTLQHQSHPPLRRRRRRTPSPPLRSRTPRRSRRHHRLRRHGRRSSLGRRWTRRRPRHRGPHLRRLRSQLRRRRRTPRNAQLLFPQRHRSKYRQRLRRGLHCRSDSACFKPSQLKRDRHSLHFAIGPT